MKLEELEELKEINESELSRVKRWTDNHSVVFITAYGSKSEYTHRENQQRNRSMLMKITNAVMGDMDVSITSVLGSYIKNYDTPKQEKNPTVEHTFMVVNKMEGDDDGKLEDRMFKIAEEFDQESILCIRKGIAELIGTSHTSEFIQYKQRIAQGEFRGGRADVFMSRVGNRPFVFKEYKIPGNISGYRPVYEFAKMPWEELEPDDRHDFSTQGVTEDTFYKDFDF